MRFGPAYTRNTFRGPEVHIGNGRGRIALWLDDVEAVDLAWHYGLGDLAFKELTEAVEKAYPDTSNTGTERDK